MTKFAQVVFLKSFPVSFTDTRSLALFLKLLDKMFEKGKHMFTSGATLLNELLHRGVETVQHSSVKEFARQGFERSKRVLASGAKLGIDIADKGVHTLERVGERALDFIALDEPVRVRSVCLCVFFVLPSSGFYSFPTSLNSSVAG